MKKIGKALSLFVLVFMLCMTAPASVFAASKLTKPVITSVKKYTDTSVQVKWKSVKKATKYYIYSSTNGKTFKKIATTTKLKYTHKNLKPGKTYYYKIKAANNKLTSNYSKVKKVKLPVVPTSVIISPETAAMRVNETIPLSTFTVKVKPANAADKSVTYWSSNTNVLVVNNAKGKMTGKKEGTAYLVAETSNGIKGKVKVNVLGDKTYVLNIYSQYLKAHEKDSKYKDFASEFGLSEVGAEFPMLCYFASGYDANYDKGFNEITRLLYFNPDQDKEIRVLSDENKYTDYDADQDVIYDDEEHHNYFIKNRNLICLYSLYGRYEEDGSYTKIEYYRVAGVDKNPLKEKTLDIEKVIYYDENGQEVPNSVKYKYSDAALLTDLSSSKTEIESLLEAFRSGKEFSLTTTRYKNTEANRSKVLG